jgi:hypothetical protein
MKWLALVLAVAGCIDTGPGPAPRVDAKYARAHLLKTEPTDLDRFDVAFGDKVIYLGNKIDHARLAPGATLKLTHYWKVLKPLGKGFRPFALVRGPQGTADFMNLDATDMQVAHPPSRWAPGEIIEDEQTITIRPDWTSPNATVYVGLIAVGRHSTLDRMAVTGPRTEDRAVVAAKLEIDLSRAPPPVGTIHIPRAGGPIIIDGQQTDQGWASSVVSPEFVTADGSPEPSGKATAKLTWDDFYLYVFITIADTDVSSPYKNHDDSLWKADAVEMFVDADGNRAGYIELQVNPHNTTFDSWFAGPRGAQGDVSWDSGMVTAVKVRGTPGPGDTDQGWDVEMGIPWTAIRGRDGNMAVKLPPRIGDRWKLNIVRVDIKSNDARQSASSWNRIGYGDWHALDKMLTAVFADPTGSIIPPVENPEPGITPPPGSGSSAGSASSITPPSVGSGSAPGSSVGSSAAPGMGSASSMTPPSAGSGSSARSNGPPRAGAGSSAGPRTGSGSGAGSSAAPRTGSGSSAGSSAAPRTGSGSSAGSSTAPRSGSGSAAPRGSRAGSATPSTGSAPPPPTAGSSSPPRASNPPAAAAPISPAGSGSSR